MASIKINGISFDDLDDILFQDDDPECGSGEIRMDEIEKMMEEYNADN